jgi:Tol biopolymer transport system component
MSEPPSSASPPAPPASEDRLDSWKAIAGYLKRDVTTVQRWEKREGMPVHRHLHDKLGSVWALRSELDVWTRRRAPQGSPAAVAGLEESQHAPVAGATAASSRRRHLPLWIWVVAAVALGASAAAVLWRLQKADAFWKNPIADAEFARITDSEGTEQAAAVSRDGRFVAFLSDRDGRVDVWVTQVGTGRFYNLSRGISSEFVNPSVRTLGFSPDGALVTFWTRKPGTQASDINILAVPILGGQPRPFLEDAAELDWSADGSRLVYHTPGPGDPMFVTDSSRISNTPPIFRAPTGLHSHFPVWSPDQSFIYFVQGTPPDRMDIWRIGTTGAGPERITFHNSRVSHPVFLDPRTLLYLATDASGSGPWIYGMDIWKRVPHRVSPGFETYTSLAAGVGSGCLVATLTASKTTLWRLSNGGASLSGSAPSRVAVTTGSAMAPRLGPGYLLYVSSQDGGDSLWKQQGDSETTLWSSAGARIAGAPAIDAQGRRVAFIARQHGRALLYVVNSDGTDVNAVDRSLEWQGAPAWAPDGRSIAAVALEGGVPRVFIASVDGGEPRLLSHDYALEPVWSPDGRFVLFSGPDVGTTFPVQRVAADGSASTSSGLTLTRGSRHLRFLADGRTLVAAKGEIRHKNLWAIDFETGAERQLTGMAPDFEIRDFDISADGREIVVERVQTQSQVVLLTLPRR